MLTAARPLGGVRVHPRPGMGRRGPELECLGVATPIDEQERRQLCDLLEQLGPDAPTLCEGWTTSDMAAHLVLREHFRRWGDDARTAEKAKGYSYLVSRLRAGPPAVPWRVPGVAGPGQRARVLHPP